MLLRRKLQYTFPFVVLFNLKPLVFEKVWGPLTLGAQGKLPLLPPPCQWHCVGHIHSAYVIYVLDRVCRLSIWG